MVYHLKAGQVQGLTAWKLLVLVEWENFPAEIDFAWELRVNFGRHHKLAVDDFVAA